MSYCRFGDGDVYAYQASGGKMHIFVAWHTGSRPHAGAFWEVGMREGVGVLRMLQAAGWGVPDDAIAEAEADAAGMGGPSNV